MVGATGQRSGGRLRANAQRVAGGVQAGRKGGNMRQTSLQEQSLPAATSASCTLVRCRLKQAKIGCFSYYGQQLQLGMLAGEAVRRERGCMLPQACRGSV